MLSVKVKCLRYETIKHETAACIWEIIIHL